MIKKLAAAFGLFMVGYVVANLSGMNTGTYSSMNAAEKTTEIPKVASGTDPMAPRKVKNNVVAYDSADPAMNAAKDKARATLDKFDFMFGEGEPGTYTIKFPLTQNGKTEHIWLQVDRLSDDGFIGRLANEPVNGNEYKMGQVLEVAKSDVEDWMVNQGDAIYGGYTARVMMDQMPEDQRAKYEKLFKD